MSADARISGRININPPITWAELHDTIDFLGRDIQLEVTALDSVGADAIVPTYNETNAYGLMDELDKAVGAWGKTPDGAVRTFTGYLHVVWGVGADTELYRVIVRDGRAVEV